MKECEEYACYQQYCPGGKCILCTTCPAFETCPYAKEPELKRENE